VVRVIISVSEMESPVPADEQRIIDQQLILRSLEGDHDAFGVLVKSYHRRLVSYLFQLVGEYENARELAQETFIRAWSALDRFNPSFRFSTWLFRIGHNLAIDTLRKRRLQTSSLTMESRDGREHELLVPDGEKNPLEQLQNREMAARLRLAINSLKDEYRELILLRHFAGLSYQEIADFKSMPLGTIKNKLFRAHSVLREKMAPDRC